jgi:hypothetical protein
MHDQYPKPYLNHSIPFNSSLELIPEYASVVNEITAAIIHKRKRQERPSSINKVFIVVQAILANLAKAWDMDEHCFVGISLRRDTYVTSKYERGLSYPILRETLNFFTKNEFIRGTSIEYGAMVSPRG